MSASAKFTTAQRIRDWCVYFLTDNQRPLDWMDWVGGSLFVAVLVATAVHAVSP